MIKEVKKQVSLLLQEDDSGHNMEHIQRVLNLSLQFAKQEKANEDIVSLIALLHDVDDYKIFGFDNANNLANANAILNSVNASEILISSVLSSIQSMGYSKLLKGIRPKTIEGMVVSDADMCDAIGANGIIRVYTYSMKHGKPFFDKNIFPVEDMTPEQYTRRCADSSVCHFFEKLLKIKNLMLTESGKKCAEQRHKIDVDFLYHLFDEENVPEWTKYLDNYIIKYNLN